MADKLKALIQAATDDGGPTAPIDQGRSEVLRGIEITPATGGLQVKMPLSLDYIKQRFRGCQFGIRGEPPPGYVGLENYGDAHWSLPVPPGFVSAQTNQERLLKEWPNYHKLVELRESIGDDRDSFVDPLTLQSLQVTHNKSTGACGRMEILRRRSTALSDARIRDIFADITVDGRKWVRQTTFMEGSRSLNYTCCHEDEYWSLALSLPVGLPLSTAYLRAEALLKKATIR